ncbi:L,D-transpeptidase [Enterococcus devriesei]|uniref:L,D-transpeptidase n=1 Tax=Enterococcus devriesei TaxID=319970 RepID=UPI001FE46D25|nr:L,D-transpeptidase [Enterococcus devriesei]
MKEYENKRVLVIVGIVAGAMMFFLSIYLYFGSHFFFGSTVANVEVGGLSVSKAAAKVKAETKQVEIKMVEKKQRRSIQIAEPYAITNDYLKKNIRKGQLSLPIKKDAHERVIDAVNQTTFPVGKMPGNAKVIYQNKQFAIQSEKEGTAIDSSHIKKKLWKDLKNGELQPEYNLSDFYRKAEVTTKDLKKEKVLQKLQALTDRKINVTVNKKKIPVTAPILVGLTDDQGNFDDAQITQWVANLEKEYSTIYKKVTFTNVHGQTLRYKNVGNYGWFIDIKQSAKKMRKELKQPKTSEISLVIQGETKKQPLHITQNYVEVDLDNQKMYCFNKGKMVVETDVITGRYAKGTATVPGFHTIMDKRRNVDLSGVLTTGDGTYNVPVDYWMPLLSHGQTITEIGLHDTDHKLQYFGQPGAFKTDLGSYGCVNTPKVEVAKIYKYSFIGMPVFIYGHIYDEAPGEFDKPVEYGTEI